jgi:hypothetical protein
MSSFFFARKTGQKILGMPGSMGVMEINEADGGKYTSHTSRIVKMASRLLVLFPGYLID